MITGVVFDMDGLVLDTESINLKYWTVAGLEQGYLIRSDLALSTIGKSPEAIELIFLSEFGPSFPYKEIRRIRDSYVKREVFLNGVPIKTGFKALMGYCKRHQIPTALATSTNKRDAEFLLYRAGLSDVFDAYTYGDDVLKRKPAPHVFLTSCDKINSAPESTLVLEDSESGIIAAKRANAIPVFVPDLFPISNIIQKNSKYHVATLSDVIRILEDLN